MTETGNTKANEDLEAFLLHLKETRNLDFSGYKRPTLERRIQRRMADAGAGDYESYSDYLETNPREFEELFAAILINVTSFFRDSEAWDYVKAEIVPQLIEARPDDEQIRVWSAGCSSGEEAYTIAIILLEALGERDFKRRVKIYATDLDEEALAKARAAIYSPEAVEGIPEELLKRYFVESGSNFAFRPDLRRSVIFGRNELLQDAPISRIDLLTCRNVLMYFTIEAQAQILSQFNFALRERGFLFLGKSEMLIRHSQLFAPVDIEARVFRPLPRRRLGERLGELVGEEAVGETPIAERHADLRKAAASIGPVARLVVDASRFLVDSNDLAGDLFSIEPADIGRPLQDLEVSYKPLELRAPLDRAFKQNEAVKVGQAKLGDPGEERIYEAEITPLMVNGEGPAGAAITFTDITDYANLVADYAKSKQELESAYEELQSTVEELETTNEVLQSTNEELETTNEELQSANEELQTMNEELASTNDELETMNLEQRKHGDELDRLNLFLEGILGNLRVGVTVVDRENRVQLWNTSAEDFWGLRSDEVTGQDFFSLDIGLPTADLHEPLQMAISGGHKSTDLAIEAVNRRGVHFTCEVRVMPLISASQGLYGGIILMREVGDEDSAPV